ERSRMVKIGGKRQQILTGRNIAVEAGMCVRQLEVRASGAAKRAANLAAQWKLQPGVDGAAGRKESDYSTGGRIHAPKNCPGLRREAKQRGRVSPKKLCARIEAVDGEIHNAGAGHISQIAGHRSL